MNVGRWLCLSALIGSVLGCNRTASPTQEVVLLVLKTQDNPFFQAMEAGVRAALQSDSVRAELLVRAGTKEGDVSTQRQVLQQAYLQYVAQQTVTKLRGVLLTPAGSESELVTEIRQLRQAGVPVVLLDTRISDEALRGARTDVDAFVGSNNEDGGRMAAVFIESRAASGTVLLLNGVDGQETARARRDGFVSEMAKARRQVVERTANWRRDEARSAVAGITALGRRFSAVFAANDEMALGAAEGLRQAGVDSSVVLVGFDAIPEAQQAVRDGAMTATVAQDPAAMGKRGVEILHDIKSGRAVVRDQFVPVRLLTADSVSRR